MIQLEKEQVKIRIVVTHNAITRLILGGLMNQDKSEKYLRVETRPERLEESNDLKIIYGNCNSNQPATQLLIFLKILNSAISELDHESKEAEIYLPHHNNDLYWLLSEHPKVKRLYYIEEGDGSILNKKRMNALRMCEVKDLCRVRQKNEDYRLLERELIGSNYPENTINYIRTIKGEGHPSLIQHKKFRGCIHISRLAFMNLPGRKNIRAYIDDVCKVNNSKRGIFYLPSKYTKAPMWIRKIDEAEAIALGGKVLQLCKEYKIQEVILKEHPSTNPDIVDIIEEILSKEVEVCRWETFLKKIDLRRTVHEAALMKFGFAIFSCKSSAISYTRTLSPNTKLLFTSFFGKHNSL